MQPDNTSRIIGAFETLKKALTPYVQDAMEATYGAEWRQQAQEGLRDPYLPQKTWDAHALLLIMSNNWHAVFNNRLGERGRNLVGELRALRNQDAPPDLNPSDVFRTLDTVARLLRAVGDEAGAQTVQQEALALMQLQFQQPPPAPPAASAETPDAEPPDAPAPAETSVASTAEKPAENNEDAPPQKEEAEATQEIDAVEETDASEETDAAQEAKTPDEEPPESIAAGVRSWFGRLFHKADEHDLEPLVLRTRLLDTIEQTLKRFRSTRPLPFNRTTVHVLAPSSNDRLTYESAINDLDPPFDQAVRHRLYDAGFDLPTDLTIKTKIHAKAPKQLEAAFEEAGPVYVALKQHAARASATITRPRR